MGVTKQRLKTIIKETVVQSIINFAQRKLESKSKATFQILDLLIPKERKIRSIVGGLETSLGTTLWEPLAKALAQENGFEVIEGNLESPSNMPSNLNNTLQSIIDARLKSESEGPYDASTSKEAIRLVCQSFINRPITSFEPASRGKGVDIWLRKEGVNYFFDTKTVKPNLAALRGCMEQVLYWYAYFFSKYSKGEAEARIVFPYNPYEKEDFWSKSIGGGKPLEKTKEAWVENEFWDFCSGYPDTFQIITTAFHEIRIDKSLEQSFNDLFQDS